MIQRAPPLPKQYCLILEPRANGMEVEWEVLPSSPFLQVQDSGLLTLSITLHFFGFLC